MKPMQARYNMFCNERGGAHDDTIFYRLDGRWLLVVNAGERRQDVGASQRSPSDSGVRLDEPARHSAADRHSRSELGRDAAAARRRRPRFDEILLLHRGHACTATPRSSRARAIPAKTASNFSSTAQTQPHDLESDCLREDAGEGSSLRVWARATCCAWKPACRSTATSSPKKSRPCKPDSTWALKIQQAASSSGKTRSSAQLDRDDLSAHRRACDGRTRARARRLSGIAGTAARRRSAQRFDRPRRSQNQEHRYRVVERTPQPTGTHARGRDSRHAACRQRSYRCHFTNARTLTYERSQDTWRSRRICCIAKNTSG